LAEQEAPRRDGRWGATRAVPSQEGQQGPWRGWAQGAGGQGSRWQDTEPLRQRQRRQGSPGGVKCSWWPAGTALPGRGQPAGTAAWRKSVTRGQAAAAGAGEAAPTRALRAAVSGHHDRFWTGQRRATARQALHVAALRMDRWTTPSQANGRRPRRSPTPFQPISVDSPGLPKSHLHSPRLLSSPQTHQTVTQTTGVRGVGEVGSVGVFFPTKGTAWGKRQL
jgi:hypothetical protein